MTLLAARNHPASCGLATTTFTRTFEKRAIANRSFDLTATENRRISVAAGETLVNIDKDGGTSGTPLKVVLRKADATYVTDYLVVINWLSEGYFQTVSLVSESTGILSNPAANGVATHQTDGECVFRATSTDGESALVKVTAATLAPAIVDAFQYWATGSLARHCADQIDGLIANKTQLNVFTSPYSAPTFTRNTACWANGVDLSCASPWNSSAGALHAGTLVSPRHVLFCKHASFYPSAGVTMYFVAPNNTVVTRTLSAVELIGNADIVVGVLNADVPAGITFAKVLPTNYATYLPGMNTVSSVPVMSLNQAERASIAGLRTLNIYFDNTYSSNYANYTGTIVAGDSGNPTFLIINGAPVLLGVFTWGGYGGGAHVAAYTTEINGAMTSLGGGYQLTAVNLTGFSTYS